VINKIINKIKNKVSKKQIIYFFGDSKELDSRISKKQEDNFDLKIEIIKKNIRENKPFQINIGISRYNFFKLFDIVKFCLELENKKIKSPKINFNVYPLSSLVNNFNRYLREITSILPKNIKLKIYDKDLEKILLKFQELDLHKADNVDDLVRLFGVLCEHAFIGPRVIVVDPHHRCNTNCTHCWVHTPKIKHCDEFLNMSFPLDRFKKLVDDAAKLKVETIILQGDGEPLLYKHCMEMLRYARSKGLDVRFFTNGILLNEKIAKEIVKIGVKEIYCSFPAGTAKTYKKINPIQKPKTYNKVVNNLKKLMEIKRKAKSESPRVIVTHVIHTQNHHELVKMAEDDVYEKVDAARFYLIRLDVMNKFLQLKEHEFKEIKRQIPIVEKILKQGGVEFVDNIKFQLENYNKKDGSWSKDIFLKHGCAIGWYFNLIPAKGDISFCCHLRTVGDLSKQSYNEIWTSNKYVKWRKQAKFMKDNMDVKFLNNQTLFDEHCTHCDNHQMLLEIFEKLKRFDLWRYYK
jgi:MoaA/NifB/PqqE/SkfB family radical SAM enzyme